MNKPLRYLLLAAGAVALVGVVAVGVTALNRGPLPAASTPAAAQNQQDPSKQLSDTGGVQVQATLVPTSSAGKAVTVTVSMNTHSVELGQFDLVKLSRITLEPGGALSDLTWTPKGNGNGHHIEGTLTANDPNDLLSSAKSVTLEISDVAAPGVRRFQWPVEKR